MLFIFFSYTSQSILNFPEGGIIRWPALIIVLLITSACERSPFFFGVALDGEANLEKLEQIKQEIGLNPGLVMIYTAWPKDPLKNNFPKKCLESIWKTGAVPIVTWEPMYIDDASEVSIDYGELVAGRYDKFIEQFAKDISEYQKPVVMRFARDMNMSRYHWGTSSEVYGKESPDIYRLMFRYVVDRFKRVNVTNALWAFSPHAESVPNTAYELSASWNTATAYYPGDDVVDLLGMNGYNWGTTQTKEQLGGVSKWLGFQAIFRPLHRELRTLSRKPIFVFETASVTKGGDKREWVREALKTSKDWNIHGVVWSPINKEVDWNLDLLSPEERRLFSNNQQSWFTERLKNRRK